MNEPYYHGIKGQRWGVKRYLNKDGTLTPTEKKRYASQYCIPKGTTLYRADSDSTNILKDKLNLE